MAIIHLPARHDTRQRIHAATKATTFILCEFNKVCLAAAALSTGSSAAVSSSERPAPPTDAVPSPASWNHWRGIWFEPTKTVGQKRK